MFSALPSLTSLDGFDRDGKEVNPPGEEDDEEDDEEESEDDGPGLEYLQKELLVGYHGDHCHVLGDSVLFLLVCGQKQVLNCCYPPASAVAIHCTCSFCDDTQVSSYKCLADGGYFHLCN